MDAATTFLVFHRSGSFGLDDAEKALRGEGVKTRREDDAVVAGAVNGPEFRVELQMGPEVLSAAVVASHGTEFVEAMATCDAQFIVSVADLDKALDEINTMMSVQGALQDLTQGYVYLSWNATVSEPWVG